MDFESGTFDVLLCFYLGVAGCLSSMINHGNAMRSYICQRLHWLILARPQPTQPRYYGLAQTINRLLRVARSGDGKSMLRFCYLSTVALALSELLFLDLRRAFTSYSICLFLRKKTVFLRNNNGSNSCLLSCDDDFVSDAHRSCCFLCACRDSVWAVMNCTSKS